MGYPNPPVKDEIRKIPADTYKPYPYPPSDQEKPLPLPPKDGYLTAYQIALKHGEATKADGTIMTEKEWIAQYGEAIAAANEAAGKANEAADSVAGYAKAAEEAQKEAEKARDEAVSAKTSSEAAKAAAEAARDKTLSYSAHPPIVGDNLHWLTWDGSVYVDTGIKATRLVDENSGNEVRMWFGTVAEYNALDTIESDVYYNILEGEA